MIILHKEMTIFPEDVFVVSKLSAKFGNISDAILSVSINNQSDSEVTPFRKGVISGSFQHLIA